MTAVLVLSTFAVFLLFDYLRSKKTVGQPAVASERRAEPAPRLQPAIVGGFEIRNNLRYHPGHACALGESPKLVRVGLDDFGARLIGKAEEIALPRRGQWLRQGQKFATVLRGGNKAELVSPIEGKVTDINQGLLKDPALLGRDPYGEGWLLAVHAPDARTNFRNLLSGGLPRRWMEEAAARLQTRMPAVAGATAQDGGGAVSDLIKHLPGEAWTELAREFFLT